MGPLAGYMLSRGRNGGAGYDVRSRELVIDRVTALCRCEYEWGVHIASYAVRAELTAEQIYSTVHGGLDDRCWSEHDQAVLAKVDELHRDGILSDEVFEALSDHFSSEIIIDLLALAGWYYAIAYIANGARTELEEWAPRFPERRG